MAVEMDLTPALLQITNRQLQFNYKLESVEVFHCQNGLEQRQTLYRQYNHKHRTVRPFHFGHEWPGQRRHGKGCSRE